MLCHDAYLYVCAFTVACCTCGDDPLHRVSKLPIVGGLYFHVIDAMVSVFACTKVYL